MLKSSIGELKLSPIKEDSMFVFFNDFIKINGKISKGDTVKVFVKQYQQNGDSFKIDETTPAKALLTVRGEEKAHDNITGFNNLEALYNHVTALYKEHYYFGEKN